MEFNPGKCQVIHITRARAPIKNSYTMHNQTIHVIFSWAQIGRSAIFGREIGVPDREIFSQQKKSIKFNVKNIYWHQHRSL